MCVNYVHYFPKTNLEVGEMVCSSKPAILIEFNDVNSNNLAGYEERTRILYMIRNILQTVIESPHKVLASIIDT